MGNLAKAARSVVSASTTTTTTTTTTATATAAAALAKKQSRAQAQLYTTLIRTHHITSRKKLQRVKKAAAQHAVPYVLVRSGGAPGIMYAEGPDEVGVGGWLAAVQGLRYKDFQCVQKPAAASFDGGGSGSGSGSASSQLSTTTHIRRQQKRPDAVADTAASASASAAASADVGFEEVTTTTEFAAKLQAKGLGTWFRQGMGYNTNKEASL